MERGEWLLRHYRFGAPLGDIGITKWYGPLWELFLGFFSHVILGFLRDPMWVRYTFNFALFPVTLFLIFDSLSRADTP
jgi:hypothetical protein